MKTGVTAVLVDVVVRDKHGLPVRDLQQSDFEVLEDGVAADDRLVHADLRGGARVPAAAATAPAAAPAAPAGSGRRRSPRWVCPITALVFDRLTPGSAPASRSRPPRAISATRRRRANYIGVFGIDLSLKSYTPFTRNAEELRKAIDSIENRASTSFGVDKDRLDAGRSAGRRGAAVVGLGSFGAGGLAGRERGIVRGTAQLARWKRGC